ncbi:Swt1 family HEPN domain-containing protein [Amycolatopsis sp. NEAU-NG30]|uniref:Swt1 family HEPN domain-containing protein n=1 Tax=Amycolatopsis melonis TaxID=3156488 RepID=A0ABV0LEW5_9PSEU
MRAVEPDGMELDQDGEDDVSRGVELPTDPESAAALNASAPTWMPWRSLALYGRWWQLETWLRDLVYVELRARHGAKWADLVKTAIGRQSQDAAFSHMAGVDNENPLAYLDYSQILEVVDGSWELFSYALLEKRSWVGRQEELKRIRHRIGHVRRPHNDDLNRIEQTLRDLELGAFRSCASYNRQSVPDPDDNNPVVKGWIRGDHVDADRLIGHAEQQYDTRFSLRVSQRPWGEWKGSLDDSTGLLWHATFYVRGRGGIDPRKLWAEVGSIRHLIVHLLVDPSEASFTFSGADDAAEVADAIGKAFDSVLYASRYGSRSFQISDPFNNKETEAWTRRAQRIDFRVLSGSLWNTVDDTTLPITIFSSGGGVSETDY